MLIGFSIISLSPGLLIVGVLIKGGFRILSTDGRIFETWGAPEREHQLNI